jgi:hypothetical protein
METLLTDEYKEYLEDLRDSGVTNMFGAPRYLMEEFGLSKADAIKITAEWMKTFDEED